MAHAQANGTTPHPPAASATSDGRDPLEPMKYIVVTGGVVSGLGKGVTISSIGRMLKNCGLRTTSIKIDPYLVGGLLLVFVIALLLLPRRTCSCVELIRSSPTMHCLVVEFNFWHCVSEDPRGLNPQRSFDLVRTPYIRTICTHAT